MTDAANWAVGDRLTGVLVGKIAHGGHWVARHEGRVIFVRHALEGEVVDVVITGLAKRHAFGDAVAVSTPDAQRVPAPCPVSARCGGCDLQHVAPEHQRELKRQVVAEQLSRLASITWHGQVETPGSLTGWRTRMRYHRGADGWGLRAKGSHEVVALPEQGCLIASPALSRPDATASSTGVGGTVLVGADTVDGARWIAPGSSDVVGERAAGRTYRVRADGFWQVHTVAPDTLVDAVLTGLRPRAGQTALDLYCGVGLFAGALTDAGVHVVGVEGGRDAVALARRNVPEAQFHAGSVDAVLTRLPRPVDLVVLDPPRAGAGRAVVEAVCHRAPRSIAYVACDPAALARDLATAGACGYEPVSIRAFDLFGMTHHVECVAILEPAPGSRQNTHDKAATA